MTRRLQLGLLGLIFLASLSASVHNLISTRDLGSTTDDPVANWELRFKPLKKNLPFDRGVVGYISDSDVAGIAFDAANEEGEYVLTQYALAPIVISRGTAQEWNVGNLSSRAYEVWSKNNHDEFEVLRLRDGLYVLRRLGG